MTTQGDRLGIGARPLLGVGSSLRPEDVPQEKPIIYGSWRNGMYAAESPENVPKDSSPFLIDMEVDLTDALIRAPGVLLDRDVAPRSALWLFQQAAVDFSTELVIIDPPYVGNKSVGDFTFRNLAVGATSQFGWAAANVGGLLLFSDGLAKTYTRAAGAAVITDISADIVARCFATFVGRIFAGAFHDPITGIQALAVAWNAANGSPTDWTGLGSGSEFLLSNNEQADYVVAMVPVGLQTLGILCRKSLWVGVETGDSTRPADFQLRFPGLGCAARDTAAATPFGIVYLSDDGVCLYDLNQSRIISQAIDPMILPLDYSRISQYRGVYNEAEQRYVLITPMGTWVYEFPHQDIPARWFFRSFIADSVAIFTNQSGGVYWDDVIGPWNLQTATWATAVIGQANAPSLTYFGRGTKVGYQNYAVTDNLGVAMTPLWQTPQDNPDVMEGIETHWFEIQYRSFADALVTFTGSDLTGVISTDPILNVVTRTLPSTGGARRRVLIGVSNMVGMGTQLQIGYGPTTICAIERVRRMVMPAGQSIISTL